MTCPHHRSESAVRLVFALEGLTAVRCPGKHIATGRVRAPIQIHCVAPAGKPRKNSHV
jgi:hypothetical protein